ncbi:MAG: DUF4398 domain-containing protein [Myxococcales bacterium]|nr:DUF4398 domain-containing protein [Myxococcales bacterium]
MFRSMRPNLKLIPLLAVVLAAGCGPFGYLKKVAKEASKAVADAEAAGAEENAPYEYWGAVSYLEQAKILMGYSEYERSFDYGERAKQLAEEAKTKAEKRRRGEMVETVDGEADGESEGDEDGEADGDASAEGSADADDGEASASGSASLKIGGGK